MTKLQKLNFKSIPTGWFIHEINTDNVSGKDLQKIMEIERDMWAHWLWEYVKCNCCWKIHSKDNIYWHLESEIKLQTVSNIEKIIDWSSICHSCWWKNENIYKEEEYIEEIKKRYSDPINSYLWVYRDMLWEIRWFFDWYIDTFEKIYENEFENYYSDIWESTLKNIIETKTKTILPEELLVCSALWMEEKNKSFYIIYELMKNFFNSLKDKNIENMVWIAESVLWTNTHSIYHSAWATKVWISNENTINNKIKNTKDDLISDIFIHEWIVEDYVSTMWDNLKTYLKENKGKMREVLKVA